MENKRVRYLDESLGKSKQEVTIVKKSTVVAMPTEFVGGRTRFSHNFGSRIAGISEAVRFLMETLIHRQYTQIVHFRTWQML